jgi:hypothetical protein
MRQSGKIDPRQAWVVDYSAARAKAIEWLGDRYLLATPINRSPRGLAMPARDGAERDPGATA